MSAIANISLYIPHVFPNFDKEYIANTFKRIGEVSEIDFVAKQDRNGKNYNAVYVHFKKWYTNKRTLVFYDSVVDPAKEARLYHDDPWYWKVLPNTAKKHVPGERKPKIDLGEANVVSKSTVLNDTHNTSAWAPRDTRYADAIKKGLNATDNHQSRIPQGNEHCFQEAEYFAEDEDFDAQMDDIEKMMEEEDANLVSVDRRYIQQIEAENFGLGIEISQLRAAIINLNQMYQAEAAKVSALSMQEA